MGANASDLGALGHKLGHLAAATTASHISSGGKDFTSSLINGANAVLGEMLMETMVDRELETAALKKKHPDLSPEELNQRFQEQTANRKHLAIWTSGALGGLFGGDVGTSASLANTAIDHNFMMTAKNFFLRNQEEESLLGDRFWEASIPTDDTDDLNESFQDQEKSFASSQEAFDDQVLKFFTPPRSTSLYDGGSYARENFAKEEKAFTKVLDDLDLARGNLSKPRGFFEKYQNSMNFSLAAERFEYAALSLTLATPLSG